MRIDSPFPSHVAQAYGLKLAQSPIPAGRTESVTPVKPASMVQQAAPAQPTMSIQPTTAAQPASISEKIGALIGGTVSGPVDFNSGMGGTNPATEAMQMYTRSADRIEAATAIQVGRQLDVKA